MDLRTLKPGDVITYTTSDGETGIQEILEINGSHIKRRIIRCDWVSGREGNEAWSSIDQYPEGWKLCEGSKVERILKAYE